MSLSLSRAQVRRFRELSADEQRAVIEGMTPSQMLALDAMFEMWANDGQEMPDGEGWRVWLMLAGRGFGKTRAGAEWVNQLAAKRGLRIALAAASIDEARAIMVEGASGILSVARSRNVKVKWEPSCKRLTWPSGSIAELYSGDSAEGLRGPEHHFAWCDELAKWRQAKGAWVVGTVKGAKLELAGAQVVGARLAAVADPGGGATIDAEARAAIAAILDRLRQHGLIAT